MHILFLTCLFFLTGCVPTYESHGYVPEKKALEQVHLGMNKEQVTSLLGTPTIVSYVDGREWYYLWANMKLETYHMPTLVDQFIISLSFDDKSRLTAVNFAGMADVNTVDYTHDKTPIYGRQAGSFEQFLAGSILARKI